MEALERRQIETDDRVAQAFVEVKLSLKEINSKLTVIELNDVSRVGNVRGAWMTLSAILAIAGAFGAAISAFIQGLAK